MALFHCNFRSQILQGNADFYAIVPPFPDDSEGVMDEASYRSGARYRTLYLLHGYSGDASSWLRASKIELYAQEFQMAVIMPSVQNSFYADMACGPRYFTYILSDLIPFVNMMFPLSGKREETFVAGLSMGGYGAFKLGLTRPDLFAAAASLSGAMDVVRVVKSDRHPEIDFSYIFGDLDKLTGSEHDLFHLADRLNESKGVKPRLFQACGTEDFLYQDNIALRDHIRKTDLDYEYREGPGIHDWYFWDTRIKEVMEWITS